MTGGQDDFIPYWLQTGMPSLETSEIPGREVMYPWEYPWPHTSRRDMWAEATALNPFVPSPALPFASTASWPSTASPFGADLKQPAPPAPLMQPWEYPWPHTSPMESRLKSSLDRWAQSTQPNPSAALPPTFPPAPPLEHLDSGKYWPVAPPVANEQRPAHGFYVSPVPQAPSWEQVPAYPADNAPSAASWATPAPPHSALKTRVNALLEHLDSGKYWPVAPSVANDEPPAWILCLAGAAGAELGPGAGQSAGVSGR